MLRARGYGAEWYCLILEIENTSVKCHLRLRANEMHCLNFGGIFSDEVFAEVNVNHAALWRHGFSKGSVNTKLMSDDEDMLLQLVYGIGELVHELIDCRRDYFLGRDCHLSCG